MTKDSIHELYAGHAGKVSDKWSLYLGEYDRLFRECREDPVRLLEIGIQNGGSLEIWSKYFSNALVLIGCDINPDCARLAYDDPRIEVVVGDANASATRELILQRSPQFDIVIDDGSHHSGDIIKSFLLYFPRMAEGGLFIAEDLHCSYWEEFQGGLFHPYSSISFFKRLVDVINHEHWGVPRARADILRGIVSTYDCDVDMDILSQVHSVEFINSMCVVRKTRPAQNGLGRRVIAGSAEAVVQGHRKLHDCQYQLASEQEQSRNPWTARVVPPDEAIMDAERALAQARQQVANLGRAVEEGNERVTALEQGIKRRDDEIHALRNSTSWRMTAPVRFAGLQLKRVRWLADLAVPALRYGGGVAGTLRKALRIHRKEGVAGIKQRLRLLAASRSGRRVKDLPLVYRQMVSQPAETVFAPRVVIIAEMSIPQCKKYRVQQKHDMFKSLGVDCTMLDWNDTQACIDALQTHSLAIFYRVPAFESVVSVINEAKRLRVPTVWEVDDFIFDRKVLAESKTLSRLERDTFDELMRGADLYRTAMLLCDRGIASTAALADAMRTSGLEDVVVIENALDQQTLATANNIHVDRGARQDAVVRIVYGSGTNTHNVDFLEAAPAILNVLGRFPHVRLRVIGELQLPDSFIPYREQVERLPICSYDKYLQSLAECDISIAPLEDYIFNEAKSNIKYLEASVLKVPSACSPRAAFSQVIVHGENGFLCDTNEEWEATIALLVADPALRAQVGEAAYDSVMQQYSPDHIAHYQLFSLLERHSRDRGKLRVLSVNCYYYPRSFGGATIVAEELNKRLNARDEFEVHVFTTLSSSDTPAYGTRRYETGGMNIYGVGVPDGIVRTAEFDNQEIVDAFANVLSVVKPDIVHFHSIQGIGVSVLDLCAAKGIDYVVTLHDAWWLCSRHFMLDQQGKFCNQKQIDPEICANCIENRRLDSYRRERLTTALHNAAVLLAPSRFSADLYNANGFCNVQVNKNGIVQPRITRRIRRQGALRFGYVGGNTEIKGFHLVRKVFSELGGYNATLVLVDNALNLGFPSYHQQDLAGLPRVEVQPAFNQDNIDEFFAGIDVLLFPTQCKESFGLTVHEALARNVWVIATDAGGVVEDIEPARNGYIVPFSDQGEGLKQAVIATIQHFERIEAGDAIVLAAKNIRFFEQQAEELANVLMSVAVSRSQRSQTLLPEKASEYAENNRVMLQNTANADL